MRITGALVAYLFLFFSAQAQTVTPGVAYGNQAINSFEVDAGDSQCATNGSPDNQTWQSYGLPASGLTIPFANVCVSGSTLAQAVTNFSSQVAPFYSSGYKRFVVNIVSAMNDIRGGATAANVYTSFQSYVNLVHALGANAKVVIPAYPIQCDTLNTPSYNTALQTINNANYANWNVPQSSGGLGADALVDYFGQPTVGDNSYTASAYCNTTYSADGEHFNDLGKSIIGPVFGPVLKKLVNGP